MSWIFNTDFYSMQNDRSMQYELRHTKKFSEAMMKEAQEGELVIGDPTEFNIKDRINDFDHGWDLDEDDVFLGMR